MAGYSRTPKKSSKYVPYERQYVAAGRSFGVYNILNVKFDKH